MRRILFTTTLLLSLFSNAQAIKENFENATLDKCDPNTCPYADFPYNGWTADKGFPYAFITMNSKQNKYVKSYSFMSSEPIYFFSPELASIEGELKFSFNGSDGKLQVGTIINKENVSTFKLLREFDIIRDKAVAVGGKDGKVPAVEIIENDAKYLVFKFVPNGPHQVFGMDNIFFTPKTFSTTEHNATTALKYALNLATHHLVFIDNDITSVKILNSSGQLILNEKVTKEGVDVSKLATGVYFIIGETEAGLTLNSKFIKK